MACQDMMLWIGDSYYRIDCCQEDVTSEACSYGPRGKVNRCYVHEAEYRGCCRRTPNIPAWAVPGATRVFLVHSATHEEGHQGTLFGYYILERFEILVDPETYRRLENPDCIPWSDDLFSEIHQDVRADYVSSEPLQRDNLGRLQEAADQQFESRRRQFVQQVTRNEVRYCEPDCTPLEDLLLEFLEKVVEDVFEKLLEAWLENRTQNWTRQVISERGARMRVLNSHHTAGETVRACSPPDDEGDPPIRHKRTKPGAVYAVDRLTARVTDQYLHLLEEESEDPDGIEEKDIARKEEVFREAVNRVHEQPVPAGYSTGDPIERLPSTLREAVIKRGELVLFPYPFPVIQRCPNASFRGYLHLDGEQLLEEVEHILGERQRLVKIPYCLDLERDGPMTNAQLETYLARELLVNKSMARRFMKILTGKAAEEIAQYGRFRLPGFGSFTSDSNGKVIFHSYSKLRSDLE